MPRTTTVSVPAPIGGWNARDALDAMQPQDAVVLDNWYPGIGKVEARRGYAGHATGTGSGDVKTAAEFHASANRKLVAAGGGTIRDATGAGTAVTLASGFTNDRWHTVNFNGRMGLVNGNDAPQQYDGSTVSALTISGSGLTPSNLVGINAFASHTFFWERDSQDFWYSAVNALGGTLTKFPLSRVGQFGGNLVCMGTWSPEGGADFWSGGGVGQDLAVFVMNSGDCIVYSGDDPGSNWALQGVYRIPVPIGDQRSVIRIGGDLGILTEGGLVSMSALVGQGKISPRGMISNKIEQAFIDAAAANKTREGWQVVYYPKRQMLLVNVPITDAVTHQYVMNVESKAWCRFTGLNGKCFGVYDSDLYFGDGAGNVREGDTSSTDNGSPVEADAQTAYSYFGDQFRGTLKRVPALRPVFRGEEAVQVGIAPQFDFQTTPATVSTLTLSPVTDAWEDVDVNWEAWDEAWEGAGLTSFSKWFLTNGMGYAVGSRVRADVSEPLEWHSTTYQLELGQGMI